jgi:hypothetical protein
MFSSDAGIIPAELPIQIDSQTVSVQGPLIGSTIALICAAVDYLSDVGTDPITVDLRGTDAHPLVPTTAGIERSGAHLNGPVVRLLLPLPDCP